MGAITAAIHTMTIPMAITIIHMGTTTVIITMMTGFPDVTDQVLLLEKIHVTRMSESVNC